MPPQPTFYADRIVNYEAATNYAYHKETVTPPGGIYFGNGLFNYALSMQYARSARLVGHVHRVPAVRMRRRRFLLRDLFSVGRRWQINCASTFTPATNTFPYRAKVSTSRTIRSSEPRCKEKRAEPRQP